MIGARPRSRPACSRRRGAVTAETLLVLPVLLLMVFCIAQMAFVSVAQLVVRHAAQRALRAAIVVLEDDPVHYGGAGRGVLVASSHAAPGSFSQALPFVANYDLPVDQLVRALVDRDPSRLNAIRVAAYLPLLVLAPSMSWAGNAPDVHTVLARHPLAQLASGLLYNLVACAVTFPERPGSQRQRASRYGPQDNVTVRVTYLFKCEIPLAARVLCDGLAELLVGVAYDPGGQGSGSTLVVDRALAQQRIDAQRARVRDLSRVEIPALQPILALRGGRYTVLSAEASLPNQGARYYPR